MNILDKKINLDLETGKAYLLVACILLVAASIVLFNLKFLPFLRLGDFIFFAAVAFAFALWRPGWCFLFFSATLALEIIDYSWVGFPISIRPYQMFAAIAFFSLLIGLLIRRPVIEMPRWTWVDSLPLVFVASGFFSGIFSQNSFLSLKYAMVAGSFVVLFYLTRIFSSNRPVLEKIVPYFLSAGSVVIVYGIWQNIAFQNTLKPFEVMPGRPNSTFSEPNWLGIYLVFLMALIFAIIYFFDKIKTDRSQIMSVDDRKKTRIRFIFLYLLLFLDFLLLVLTVSRSAWLGAAATAIVFLILIFTDLDFRETRWKKTGQYALSLALITAAAIASIYVFRLSDFQIANRFQSTGTGLQKITVACRSDVSLPETIKQLDELNQLNCEFIRLEDIDGLRSEGLFIKEINRIDPNVSIRGGIYRKTWKEIVQHPVLGVGWGNIPEILGKDERGTALNASNIFLEIWLGTGIFGLISFSAMLIYILLIHSKTFFEKNDSYRIESSFALMGLVALLIPNLFNAGIFMGILWFYLALAVSLRYNKSPS